MRILNVLNANALLFIIQFVVGGEKKSNFHYYHVGEVVASRQIVWIFSRCLKSEEVRAAAISWMYILS